MKSGKLPQVMSLDSASVWARNYKFREKNPALRKGAVALLRTAMDCRVMI